MEYLKYDLMKKKKNDYNKLSFEEQIEKISRFTSAICRSTHLLKERREQQLYL